MPTVARPRVLIIAEHCNPEWTSVPLEGWSHYLALSRVTDAHLVTQVRNRESLVRAGLVEGTDFTAIDSEKVARPLTKLAGLLRGGAGKGYTTMMAMSVPNMMYFEHLLKRAFKAKLRAKAFDVVHQLTPLSPTQPPRTANLCRRLGVPFVWGPINGGLPWPPGFGKALRQEREWLSLVRGAYKFLPGYTSSRRSAAAILAGSTDTHRQIDARYHEKTIYVAENGVDPDRFTVDRTRVAGLPIRICFVGRLVPYKGGDMLLEAAEPILKAGAAIIDFFGNGPHRATLESIVADRALPGVTFLGHVDHATLAARLATYDVLGFPSIREFGGAVAIEAMALGVVPIVPEYGGLGDLVSEATGFRVPMGSREAIVAAFRGVLERIVANPGVLAEKSARGRDRVARHFTWAQKAQQDLKVYDWVMGRGAKPAFAMPTPDDVDA